MKVVMLLLVEQSPLLFRLAMAGELFSLPVGIVPRIIPNNKPL
jgi:hypothetical protein